MLALIPMCGCGRLSRRTSDVSLAFVNLPITEHNRQVVACKGGEYINVSGSPSTRKGDGVAKGGKIGSKTIDKLFGNLVLREDNGVIIQLRYTTLKLCRISIDRHSGWAEVTIKFNHLGTVVGLGPFRVEDQEGLMEEFDPFSMESSGVSVHDRRCLLFVCMAEGAVRVFANCSVVGSGSSNYFTRCNVINSTPFSKGYNGKDIIVPLNGVLAFQVEEFWKCRNIGTFELPDSDLLCEGILGCGSLLCC